MNWHETILHIRQNPEFKSLVKDAYFDEDLAQNVLNFRNGKEYIKTLELFKKYNPLAKNILDIGAGNGISTINFALDGYTVTAVEPDPSDTVGANAIKYLIGKFNLNNVDVYEKLAEEISFADETFDIVYVRQALHHANNLIDFVKEASRVLKKGGILITIRDHVIFNRKDKDSFFENHPLHKFYGGENAYSAEQYKQAFKNADLDIELELKYFDSEINYFPHTKESIVELKKMFHENLISSFRKKFGYLAKLPFLFWLYKLKNGFQEGNDEYYEKMVSGRMYSYVLRK